MAAASPLLLMESNGSSSSGGRARGSSNTRSVGSGNGSVAVGGSSSFDVRSLLSHRHEGYSLLSDKGKKKNGKKGLANSYCPNYKRRFTWSRLKITIVQARNLPNTQMFDTPDSYVQFCADFVFDGQVRQPSCGFGQGLWAQSPMRKNEVNPTWNFGCSYSLPEADLLQLTVKVFDDDSDMPWKRDDFLGQAQFQFHLSGLSSHGQQAHLLDGYQRQVGRSAPATVALKVEVDHPFLTLVVLVTVILSGMCLTVLAIRSMLRPSPSSQSSRVPPLRGAGASPWPPVPPQGLEMSSIAARPQVSPYWGAQGPPPCNWQSPPGSRGI